MREAGRLEAGRSEARLFEARQTLHELQHRLPTIVYVLDQIIQTQLITQAQKKAQDDDSAIEMPPTFEKLVNVLRLTHLFAVRASKNPELI